MLDVKVLILFVTARSSFPMTMQEVYEVCYQDDCLSYFDVCTAIPEMVRSGHLRELEDGEAFPEKADFAEIEAALDTSVDQGEWNGFEDMFMYSVADEQYFEQVFIAPVVDDDGEIDGILTINVRVEKTDDEETGMNRDDAISAVLDTLELLDD